jgi:hypothetical protein
MITVKKKVACPEFLFFLTLICRTAGTARGSGPAGFTRRAAPEIGSDSLAGLVGFGLIIEGIDARDHSFSELARRSQYTPVRTWPG